MPSIRLGQIVRQVQNPDMRGPGVAERHGDEVPGHQDEDAHSGQVARVLKDLRDVEGDDVLEEEEFPEGAEQGGQSLAGNQAGREQDHRGDEQDGTQSEADDASKSPASS